MPVPPPAVREKRSRAFFKSGQDLSVSYAKNFASEGSSSKGVESVIVTTVFKPLVTKLVDKIAWLRYLLHKWLYALLWTSKLPTVKMPKKH
jgi:hypothetical protein